MTRVYIGIGSNIERERHIATAIERLDALFGHLIVSPVYESDAIGFSGAPFFNLVVGFDTEQTIVDLLAQMRTIENDNGNDGKQPKFSARSLDLDLLTYGDYCGVSAGAVLPRADITDYAYALWPLADIAADELHPQLLISYRELRQQFGEAQKLWPVSFVWQSCDLSAVKRAS
jgi:2-amino-4-hydroxy-6-hydroxymethyldihydropteridine diphosphokinase